MSLVLKWPPPPSHAYHSLEHTSVVQQQQLFSLTLLHTRVCDTRGPQNDLIETHRTRKTSLDVITILYNIFRVRSIR